MKILIVSSYLPYPLFSGGHIRLYNLIRELSEKYEITLLCEIRDHQTEEDIEAVRKICKEVITIPRKKQWTIANIASAGFSVYPFLMTGHTQPRMCEIVQQIQASFDVIHVETFYVYHNLPMVTTPTVLVEHNIEYHVYERYVRNMPLSKIFLRPLLFLDVQKMKYWENRYWKEASKLVAVSEIDKKIMNREDAMVVPNGVDLASYPFLKKTDRTGTILYIGDFSWVQNRDAVRWILTVIVPKLPENIKLWIVGKKIPADIKMLANDSRILFDEHAPKETAKIYAQADVLLAPIRVGGGTSYKILEAMASGVPVVTTSLGAAGIGAVHKKNVWIADTAEGIADGVTNLLSNRPQADEMAKHARVLIETTFNWKEICKKLEEAYSQAIDAKA